MIIRGCIVSILGAFLLHVSCYAQSEQGFTLWPDPDEGECFIVSPPQSIPMYRSDMPFEVALAYKVTDSVCKSLTRTEIIDGLARMSDDSITVAWQVYQRAKDYDPFLLLYLWRYSTYVDFPDSYSSAWSNVTGQLNYQYNKRFRGVDSQLGERLDMDDLSVLCSKSYGIYLVRGIERLQRVYIDSSRGRPCSHTVNCMDCEVLRIYQGNNYYSSCDPETYELGDGIGCIRYHWSTNSCDSAFYQYPGYKEMLPNHDYLVFTEYDYRSTDNYPSRRYAVSALRIFEVVDGTLLDPLEYFGQGTSVQFDTIESLVQKTMKELRGED